MGTLPSPPKLIVSEDLSLQVRYVINLPYFVILLDNNILVAMQYLKTMIKLKNFRETKMCDQTIWFALRSEKVEIHNQWTFAPGRNWWN